MSLSIHDSLHASRHSLTHSAFPALPSPAAAPHTLTPLGTLTLSIGPHFFRRVALFLCLWSSSAAAAPTGGEGAAEGVAGEISPALIAQLNAAAATDPSLGDVLRKAASGQAHPQELAHLGGYIERLKGSSTAEGARPAVDSTTPSVVLEFVEENPGKRWVLPQNLLYTPLAPGGTEQSILLSFFLLPSASPSLLSRYQQRLKASDHDATTASALLGLAPPSAPVPVDLVVHAAGEEVRQGLWRAARNSRKVRDAGLEREWGEMIAATPPRVSVLYVPPAPTPTAAAAAEAAPELSRTASEQPSASGSGAGTKRGGTPLQGGPPAKKGKAAPKKKAAPRPRARSSLSAAASLPPGTPMLSGSPAPSSAAGAGSPGPASLAGSPAPEASAAAKGKGGKRAPAKKKAPAAAKKGGAKGKGKGKAKQEEDLEGGGEAMEQQAPPVARRTSGRERKGRGVKLEDLDSDDGEGAEDGGAWKG
ncbi:hypothetical protein JCM10213v2_003194 [Rhodosporidiobolus nylandii]